MSVYDIVIIFSMSLFASFLYVHIRFALSQIIKRLHSIAVAASIHPWSALDICATPPVAAGIADAMLLDEAPPDLVFVAVAAALTSPALSQSPKAELTTPFACVGVKALPEASVVDGGKLIVPRYRLH